MNELALATIPGMFSPGSAARPRAFGVYRPAAVPAELVPQYVTFLDGERTVVDPVPTPAEPASPVPSPAPSVDGRDWGPTLPSPLGRVVGTRSGDKGGNANLGVFARSADAFEWLDGFLSTERLRELLPEAAPLRVDRHRLPNIWSLNFVIHGLLGDGVAASDRQDPQAKSLGEWLRARMVEVPEDLLRGGAHRRESRFVRAMR